MRVPSVGLFPSCPPSAPIIAKCQLPTSRLRPGVISGLHVIFGLGLHESNVEEFLKAAKPDLTQQGCAPMGETGVFQCVSSGRKIAGGGYAAGFELLATCSGLLTCSWLCNGLEKDCAHRLGIAPNRHGLIESYRDALRCAEFVSRPETRAEPGLWLPWLVTVYSA